MRVRLELGRWRVDLTIGRQPDSGVLADVVEVPDNVFPLDARTPLRCRPGAQCLSSAHEGSQRV